MLIFVAIKQIQNDAVQPSDRLHFKQGDRNKVDNNEKGNWMAQT